MKEKGDKNALLLLGCPELPVQTSIALYLANKLKKGGINVVVAGTDAALNLLKVADPEGHYIDMEKMINLDRCIEDLAEKRKYFDLCFVFVHNDAGISYLETMHHISNASLFAIIFGNDVDPLTKMIDFKCEKIVAKAVHNPIPLKKKIDDKIREAKRARWAV
jgi:hypothetical protein